jgi:hypothetical protein
MTVIGALSSFRELGEMSPHKRACSDRSGEPLDARSVRLSVVDGDEGRRSAG